MHVCCWYQGFVVLRKRQAITLSDTEQSNKAIYDIKDVIGDIRRRFANCSVDGKGLKEHPTAFPGISSLFVHFLFAKFCDCTQRDQCTHLNMFVRLFGEASHSEIAIWATSLRTDLFDECCHQGHGLERRVGAGRHGRPCTPPGEIPLTRSDIRSQRHNGNIFETSNFAATILTMSRLLKFISGDSIVSSVLLLSTMLKIMLETVILINTCLYKSHSLMNETEMQHVGKLHARQLQS